MTLSIPKTMILGAAVFIAAVCVYANSVPCDLVWDDKNLIVNNPDIHSATPENIRTIFTHDLIYRIDRSNFYRPLQSLSYMLDHVIWGKMAAGYHLANAVLHALNAYLVFILLFYMFRSYISALIGALFFAVHPLHTSAVTYVAGRADLLALFFLLVSTFFMFRSSEIGTWRSMVLSSVLFVLALLSKEICAVFPLFAILYLALNGDKERQKAYPLVAALAVTGIIYLIMRGTVLKFAPLTSQAIDPPPLGMRLLLLWPVLAAYFRLMVFPYDLRMDRDIAIPSTIMDPAVARSILVVCVMAFLFWICFRKDKKAWLGLGWFFIFLFPSLNILIPLNAPISEHWLYIPFFGISIILACAVSMMNAPGKPFVRKIVAAAASLALIAYAATTVYVNLSWKDEKTLFAYIARFKKVHFRAHYNLGCQHIQAGKYEEAVEEFGKVLARAPDELNTLLMMAVAHARLRHFDTAYRYFDEALRVKPGYADGYVVFADTLSAMGRSDKAQLLLEKAIELDPGKPAAYNALGIIYADKGMLEKARSLWMQGMQADPASKEIKANLDRLDKLAAKAAEFDALMNNVNKYVGEGKYDLALGECKKAAAINPKSVTVRNNLGVLYGMMNMDAEAVAEFKAAVKLSPKEAGAYKNIAIIYSKYPDKRKEAVEYFEKYLVYEPSSPDRPLIEQKLRELRSRL